MGKVRRPARDVSADIEANKKQYSRQKTRANRFNSVTDGQCLSACVVVRVAISSHHNRIRCQNGSTLSAAAAVAAAAKRYLKWWHKCHPVANTRFRLHSEPPKHNAYYCAKLTTEAWS